MYNFEITLNRWVKMHSNWYHNTCVTIEKIFSDNPHGMVLTYRICPASKRQTKETICYSVYRHYHFYSSSSKRKEKKLILFFSLSSAQKCHRNGEKNLIFSVILKNYPTATHSVNIWRQIYTQTPTSLTTNWLTGCWLLCLLRNKENFRIAVMCNMK